MQALPIRRACSYWERLVSMPPQLLRTARSTTSIPLRTHWRTLWPITQPKNASIALRLPVFPDFLGRGWLDQ